MLFFRSVMQCSKYYISKKSKSQGSYHEKKFIVAFFHLSHLTFVNKNPRSNKSYLNLDFLSLNKLSVFIVLWASPGCSGNLLEICHVKDSKGSIFQPPGPDFCLMRCYSIVLGVTIFCVNLNMVDLFQT